MKTIRGSGITLLNSDPPTQKKRWKGSQIFDERYWITAICAKRRSGKTVFLSNLVRKFATKNTPVLIFASTFHNDREWRSLARWLRQKKIPYESFTEIKSETGLDYVRTLMDTLKEKAAEDDEHLESFDPVEEKEQPHVQTPALSCGRRGAAVRFDTEKPEQKRKRKKSEPEHIIVFDDLSGDLRADSVNRLLKNSRHFKCRIILSSQSVTDFHPHSWHQLDYAVLFKNQTEEELRKLYDRLDLWVAFPRFLQIYHRVTQKPWTALLVDRNNEQFRENLGKILPDSI